MKYIYKTPFILLICVAIHCLCSCNPQGENLLTIGSNFTSAKTRIVKVDTFSINMSTIIMDSIVTSSAETALVGKLNDDNLGKLEVCSYFQIGAPSNYTIEADDIYDSISLVLQYSSYYYGDTTKNFSIEVHQVLDTMEAFSDGYLYNKSEFSYSAFPVGVVNFYPKPASGNEIEIKLQDEFGLSLFDKLVNSYSDISSDESFVEYIHGLMLKTGDIENETVLGFHLNDSTMSLRIYGHRFNEEREDWEMDLPVIENELRFNQFIYDRTNTVLAGLVSQRVGVPSNLTKNRTFLQGGTGLMTKVVFPWLGGMLEITDAAFFRAELVLHPIINDNNSAFLPTKYFIYQGGKYNVIEGTYSDSEGNAYYGNVEIDQVFNTSSITFDITDYLQSKFSGSYYDADFSLILSYDDPEYKASCSAIQIGGFENSEYKPTLNVYYIYYE